ncbi:MAG TPA: type II toxin-antitoxin system prevent-host-death family antitoxin [Bauldia sp.]|nr:type II toxin-antitoxin system prevent-host-death family antitoxin [Bauldia sp.]
MHKVNVSEATGQFDSLLREVERGEIVEVSRDGKVVARVVPAGAVLGSNFRTPERQAEIERAMEDIKAIRERGTPVTVEEILAMRDEGRR